MKRVGRKGNVLIIVLIFILITAVGVGAFLGFVNHNSSLSWRINNAERAFYIAEAGLEQALYRLKLDFENDSDDPGWGDGEINGQVCGPDSDSFYDLPPGSTSFRGGSYYVRLKNVAGEGKKIWVRSTGIYRGLSRTIEVCAEVEDYNVWNNSIFAGVGASGHAVHGNVDVRGSVHILGNGLTDADMAMNLSGSAKIGNNYKDIPGDLADRIPDCPVVMYNGEVIESLGAEVRIKQGLLGLNGTGTAGEMDVSGNLYKETLDGVYIQHGYGGNQGENNVFSDNGTATGYDLGDEINFPTLSAPYQGYATYQDYLSDNALVISDPAVLSDFSSITPGASFNYTDPEGKGSIAMDGSGNLVISGIVYLNGGALTMDKSETADTITYTGKGIIFATEGAGINLNLLTEGMDSFPAHALGVMTPGDITFDGANINVMGLFYAEDSIAALKQTNIAGTFVSNYFDMGTQVPSIFKVPTLAENLPLGLISEDPIWIVTTSCWREI